MSRIKRKAMNCLLVMLIVSFLLALALGPKGLIIGAGAGAVLWVAFNLQMRVILKCRPRS